MKNLFFAALTLFSLATFADTKTKVEKFSVEKVEIKQDSTTGLEIGLATGFPALLGITLGYWGKPVVVRLTTGVGSQIDIGMQIKGNETIRRIFFGFTAGALGYFGVLDQTYYTLGPTVGLSMGNFFLQAGPCLSYRSANSRSAASSSLSAQGQIGYTVVF